MNNSYIIITSSSSSSLFPIIDPISNCHRFVAVFFYDCLAVFSCSFPKAHTYMLPKSITHTHTHTHTFPRSVTQAVNKTWHQQKVQHTIFSTSLATGRPSWAFHWHRRFPHQHDLWHHQVWQRCSSSPSPCWFGKTSAKTQHAKEMLSVLVFTYIYIYIY